MMPARTQGFKAAWLAETLRLRETQWGPLDDGAEIRRLHRECPGASLPDLLLQRAALLGQRDGLDRLITLWSRRARLALLILLLAAVFAGAAAAAGILGGGTRQINILLALTGLLGLHSLSLALWWIGPLLARNEARSGLGELWLWLSGRLARGPDTALVLQGLVSLLTRQRSLRSALGCVSHLWWLLALLAMLAVLIALLSARRYTFGWETTLLSPETMLTFVRGLAWLPDKLGFSFPPDDIVLVSDGLTPLPDSAGALWSGWLLGCITCYGVLPRALALVVNALHCRRHLSGMHPDPGLPGFAELRERLRAPSRPGQTDAPPPVFPKSHHQHNEITPAARGASGAIVGLELAPDTAWPPPGFHPGLLDLGVVDSRSQRQQLGARLEQQSMPRLLIVCDGLQTPDRGIVRWIMELSGLAQEVQLALMGDTGPAQRLENWRQSLTQAGFPSQHIHSTLAPALAWLSSQSAGQVAP